MKRITYRGLAEFGLPLVPPGSPTFSSFVRDIENRPQPFGSWDTEDLETSAVLLNQSGKAIVTLAFIWRYTTAHGKTRTSHFCDLGSSMQLDVLSGRVKAARVPGSFILPGSKRLITEHGMFGNNLDVLPAVDARRGGGHGGGGGGAQERSRNDIAEVELSLQLAIFEDGLCAGPDESGLLDSITSDLERQREAARKIVTDLLNGASKGPVFEILTPLAHRIPRHGKSVSNLLPIFASIAIQHLVNADGPELLAWFKDFADPSAFRLHRPA
jgi:hypothetical protein